MLARSFETQRFWSFMIIFSMLAFTFSCKKSEKGTTNDNSQVRENTSSDDSLNIVMDEKPLVEKAIENDVNVISDLAEYISQYQIVPKKTMEEQIGFDVSSNGIAAKDSSIPSFTVTLEDIEGFSDEERQRLLLYVKEVHSRLLLDNAKASTNLTEWYLNAHLSYSGIFDLYRLIMDNYSSPESAPNQFIEELTKGDRNRVLSFFEPYIIPVLFLPNDERSDLALQEDYLDFTHLNLVSAVDETDESEDDVKARISAKYLLAEDPISVLESYLEDPSSEINVPDFEIRGSIAAYAKIIVESRQPANPPLFIFNKNGLPSLEDPAKTKEAQSLNLTGVTIRGTVTSIDINVRNTVKALEADGPLTTRLNTQLGRLPTIPRLESNLASLRSTDIGSVKTAYKDWQAKSNDVRFNMSTAERDFFSADGKAPIGGNFIGKIRTDADAVTDPAVMKVKVSNVPELRDKTIVGVSQGAGDTRILVFKDADGKTFSRNLEKDTTAGVPENSWKIKAGEAEVEVKSRLALAAEAEQTLLKAYKDNVGKELSIGQVNSFFYTRHFAWNLPSKFIRSVGMAAWEGLIFVPRQVLWLGRTTIKSVIAIVDGPIVLFVRFKRLLTDISTVKAENARLKTELETMTATNATNRMKKDVANDKIRRFNELLTEAEKSNRAASKQLSEALAREKAMAKKLTELQATKPAAANTIAKFFGLPL